MRSERVECEEQPGRRISNSYSKQNLWEASCPRGDESSSQWRTQAGYPSEKGSNSNQWAFPEYLLISLNASDSAYPHSCTSRVRISTEVPSWREDNQAAGKVGMGFGYRSKHCSAEKREEGMRRMYGKIQREWRRKEGWDKVGSGRKDREEERSRGGNEETARARLSLWQGAAPPSPAALLSHSFPLAEKLECLFPPAPFCSALVFPRLLCSSPFQALAEGKC